MAAQKKKTALSEGKNRTATAAKFNLTIIRARLAEGSKAFVSKAARLPRPLQIFTIYLLTVFIVGGFFFWRLSQMQVENPYTSENAPHQFEPLWGDYAAGSETVTRQEVYPADLQPVVEGQESPAAPPEETPVAAPVYPSEEEIGPAFNATWPVEGQLLYGFHDLKSQMLNPPYSSHRYSRGVAIKTASDAEVLAIESGVVIKVTRIDYPRGSSVIIRHHDNLESYYGGLTEISVSEGSEVSRGQLLGFVSVGATGEDPVYLYLEIRENNTPVDPLLYLAAGR